MTISGAIRTFALATAGLLVWLSLGPTVFSQEGAVEDPATARFALERYDVDEGAAVEVELRLSGSPGESVTIPAAVTPGDTNGASPEDYAISPEGGFAFGPDDISAVITLTAHSDSEVEPAESLVISLDLEGVTWIGGDPPTTTVSINDVPPPLNRAPEAAGEGPIAELSLTAHVAAPPLDLSDAFTDPDDDALTYTAASGDETVATAALSGAVLTVTPLDAGSAIVTVTATDPGGLSASREITVTVAALTVALSGDSTVTEGDAAQFTASLAGGQSLAVDVPLAWTAAGSGDSPATPGDDFTAAGTVVIPAGENAASFNVPTVDDAIVEGEESFSVSIGLGDNPLAGVAVAAAVTIADNDSETPAAAGTSPAIELGLDPAEVNEDAGATSVTVTASLPEGLPAPEAGIELTVSVTGDEAAAGDDFAAVAGFPLTIPAGETSGTASFTLEPVDDELAEGPETLTVSAAAPDSAGLSGGEAPFVILDDDEAFVTVEDVTVAEGDGEATVAFTLDRAVPGGFTFTASTRDGTAVAGEDYTAVSETLTFAGLAGETQTLTVPVLADLVDEASETFSVVLGPVEGTRVPIAVPGRATVTIAGRDAQEQLSFLSIQDLQGNDLVSVSEGDVVRVQFLVEGVTGRGDTNGTVRLVTVSDPPFSPGTATRNVDYHATDRDNPFWTIAYESATGRGVLDPNLTITIHRDVVVDDGETIVFSVRVPGYGTAFDTLTIDDASPATTPVTAVPHGDQGLLFRVTWDEPHYDDDIVRITSIRTGSQVTTLSGGSHGGEYVTTTPYVSGSRWRVEVIVPWPGTDIFVRGSTEVVARPAAPTGLTLVAGDAPGSLMASWDAVSVGTGVNVEYVVEHKRDDAPDDTAWSSAGVEVDQAARTAVITELDRNVAYRVRVAAQVVGETPPNVSAYQIMTATSAANYVISVSADTTTAAEGGAFAVTVSLPDGVTLEEAVPLTWSVAGALPNPAGDDDHDTGTGSGAIPAGQSSVEFQVGAVQDTLDEVDEAFVLTVALGANAPDTVEIPAPSVTLNITDDDTQPAAPANLAASGGYERVALGWDAVTDADTGMLNGRPLTVTGYEYRQAENETDLATAATWTNHRLRRRRPRLRSNGS